jgi:HEAT repeat protein
VRRRAAELAAGVTGRGSRSSLPAALRAALEDPDPLVTEASCFALGERRDRGAVVDLAHVAGGHPDNRCREAAVAALGAIGDPAGLAAVVAALGDKPTVRRRATVALAAFAGPEAAAAMRRSLTDRDWQVREVAEILLGEPPG